MQVSPSHCVHRGCYRTDCRVSGTTAVPVGPAVGDPPPPAASPDVQALIDRLSSPDSMERALACNDLRKLHGAALPAMPRLLALLGDDAQTILPEESTGGTVGGRAAYVLVEKIGQPAVEPLMKAAFDDPNPVVRRNAGQALRDMMWPTSLRRLPGVAERLLAELRSPNATRRTRAADVLAQAIDLPEILPPLIAAAHDPDVGARLAVVKALARQQDQSWHESVTDLPNVVAALTEALKDPDPEIRMAALRGMQKTASPDTPKTLEPLLQDPDPRVRALTADSLRLLEQTKAWLEEAKRHRR